MNPPATPYEFKCNLGDLGFSVAGEERWIVFGGIALMVVILIVSLIWVRKHPLSQRPAANMLGWLVIGAGVLVVGALGGVGLERRACAKSFAQRVERATHSQAFQERVADALEPHLREDLSAARQQVVDLTIQLRTLQASKTDHSGLQGDVLPIAALIALALLGALSGYLVGRDRADRWKRGDDGWTPIDKQGATLPDLRSGASFDALSEILRRRAYDYLHELVNIHEEMEKSKNKPS